MVPSSYTGPIRSCYSRRMKKIIWDWNGTLLNDAGLIAEIANGILSRRNYPTVTLDEMRELSCHPASEWYRRMGVDFARHPFDQIVSEFHSDYLNGFSKAELHTDTAKVLSMLKQLGTNQYVLSAHLHSSLIANIATLGLSHFFDEIVGLDDGHAHSKVENGIDIAKRHDMHADNSVVIGDSSHDAEVAAALRIPCLLVARGIESERRLRASGCPVFPTLEAAIAEVF